MARMYPSELPEGEATAAEQRVFAALRDRLPDEWEAFHSVSWMSRDHVKGVLDGEIDSVLCHPRRAIVVVLEIKGQGVECVHATWSRRQPQGKRVRINDPFKQALDHRYDPERKINEADGRRGRTC